MFRWIASFVFRFIALRAQTTPLAMTNFGAAIRRYSTAPRTSKIRDRYISLPSSIRTITVGPGISPDLLTFLLSSQEKALAGFLIPISKDQDTAGGEFHSALKVHICKFYRKQQRRTREKIMSVFPHRP